MSKSTVQWTDRTCNCVAGCDPISPGCANCYAIEIARRMKSGLAGPQNGKKASHRQLAVIGQYTGLTESTEYTDRKLGLGSLQLHPGTATTVAMGAALARIAKVPGFELMGATPPGEPTTIALAEAVAYVQRTCLVVAERMSPHALTSGEIAGVVATIRRVADGYDSLRGYDLPVATALRCAANLIERSEK